MLLAGLRRAWGAESERGHLALRQGTASPAPLVLSGSEEGVGEDTSRSGKGLPPLATLLYEWISDPLDLT